MNNDIEGADVWSDFLERCRERKIQIRACEVERESFPAPTASFEAVLFCELFEHLHLNPFHTLKEIFRVLRPGGLLILTTPNLRRAETLFRYLHGWGAQPPVSRTFHELWPSLLYHRHNREYTANELAYYLALQGKDLYEFRLDQLLLDCLEGDPDVPVVLGQRLPGWEQALARGLRRLMPSTPGPADRAGLAERGHAGPVGGPPASRRLRTPHRGRSADSGVHAPPHLPISVDRAGSRFEVPLPAGPGPALVSLMVADPAPDTAPALRTRWTLDGVSAMTLELRPAPGRCACVFSCLRSSPRAGRCGSASPPRRGTTRGRVGRSAFTSVGSGSSPAPPDIDGGGGRPRSRPRRATRRGVRHRLVAGRQSLYMPGRAMPASLEMGPGDEGQLGLGWHHREDWGKPGVIRWTSAKRWPTSDRGSRDQPPRPSVLRRAASR